MPLFPHARQVFLIERYVTRKVRRRKKNSRKYTTVTPGPPSPRCASPAWTPVRRACRGGERSGVPAGTRDR